MVLEGFYDDGGGLKNRNFNSLFSVFALKGAGKEKLVPFGYVYRIARRERRPIRDYKDEQNKSYKKDSGRDSRDEKRALFNPVLQALGAGEDKPFKKRLPDPFEDPVIEEAMTLEAHRRLIIYVADVALGDKSCDVVEIFGGESEKDKDSRDRYDNDYGNRDGYDRGRRRSRRRPQMTIRELVDILRAAPFSIFEHSYHGIVMEEREVVSVLSKNYVTDDDDDRYKRKSSSFKRRSSD